MTLDELGQDKRAAILSIAEKHGVRSVRIFGSFARSLVDSLSISRKNWGAESISQKRVPCIR
jgi:hypothetical protein